MFHRPRPFSMGCAQPLLVGNAICMLIISCRFLSVRTCDSILKTCGLDVMVAIERKRDGSRCPEGTGSAGQIGGVCRVRPWRADPKKFASFEENSQLAVCD